MQDLLSSHGTQLLVEGDENSNFVYVTMYNSNWKDLACKTIPNKEEYCKKHNYPLLVKTDEWKQQSNRTIHEVNK
jgi:hypothetical protein